MAFAVYIVAARAEVCDVQQPVAAPTQGEWRLVWSDEFNSHAIDGARWNFDLGGTGWGNNELQTYTQRPANARIKKGKLLITARRESFTGEDGVARDFTSARINTQDKFHVRYGRIEARIKLPAGKGLWPAFWLISVAKRDAEHRPCGEIDIMENIGTEPKAVHSTLHVPGDKLAFDFTLPKGERFSKDFHVFGVDWDPNSIRFYVDRKLSRVVSREQLTPWVFDRDFYIVVNMAVGGDWPGPPDSSTKFPQSVQVDWVRVWVR